MGPAVDPRHGAALEPPRVRPAPAQHILSEIAASLSAEHDLEGLLQRFLGTIVELCGAAAGAARVLTEDAQHLRLIGAVGLPAEVLQREALVGLDCGVCGDAARDDRIGEASDVRICAERSSCSYFGADCTRVLAVPLCHRGRILGVYNLFLGANRHVSSDTLSLLRSIGELLGLALENARLARANMHATLLCERQMMANEMHDALAQTLSYMKMRMSLLMKAIAEHDDARSLKYAGDVNQALSGAYTSLRELLTQFRSGMDPQGLLHALATVASTFYDKTGVELEFENHAPDLNLPMEQELQVFHIVNEALANVGRHSGARHARVVLDRRQGSYEVRIEDDGSGMVRRRGSAGESQPSRPEAHYGMSIMRERARQIGGKVEIESAPGGGTRVRLIFPGVEVRTGE